MNAEKLLIDEVVKQTKMMNKYLKSELYYSQRFIEYTHELVGMLKCLQAIRSNKNKTYGVIYHTDSVEFGYNENDAWITIA